MSGMSGLLTLEVVTPLGLVLSEEDVEEVVVRRREPGPTPGSEVAIFPLHAPMLVRTCDCVLRYTKSEETHRLRVGGGFVEVLDDHVTVLAPYAEKAGVKAL